MESFPLIQRKPVPRQMANQSLNDDGNDGVDLTQRALRPSEDRNITMQTSSQSSHETSILVTPPSQNTIKRHADERVNPSGAQHHPRDISLGKSTEDNLELLRPEESLDTKQLSIHWLSPTLMIGAFVASVLLAVGHHEYYTFLNGQEVGDRARQQWALRFGNAFAFLVKACLTTAGGISYIQWLWRTLRRKYVAVDGIDAAFAVRGSLLPFLNLEMLSKFKIGTLMAVIIWCIPLSAIFTPATLSVRTDQRQSTKNFSVPSLDIGQYINGSNSLQFDAYSVAEEQVEKFAQVSSGFHGGYWINGPSSRLGRMIASTAGTSQLFTIQRPTTNANTTYQIEFTAPAVRCDASNASVARNTTIAAMFFTGLATNSSMNIDISGIDFESLLYHNKSSELAINVLAMQYFAMIPEAHFDMDVFQPMDFSQAEQGGSVVSNQLWIAIADHDRETNFTVPRFFTCELWNASQTLKVSFANDIQQNLQIVKTTYLHTIDRFVCWSGIDCKLEPDLSQASYTAFFWGVCEQVVGHSFTTYSRGRTNHDSSGNIQNTVMAGATEYVAMLKNISYGKLGLGAVQPLNKSLAVLIEELATNSTLNMLSDNVLSTFVTAQVTSSLSVNIYTYDPWNLIAAYLLAIIFCFFILILGCSAYRSNGVGYDDSISTIMRTMQNPDISRLVSSATIGSQPLSSNIANTKLRFGILTTPPTAVAATTSHDRHGERMLQTNRFPGFGVEGSVDRI